MSARSRAQPWWGPRKAFGPSPVQAIAPLQWIPIVPSETDRQITDWLQYASSYDLWKQPGDPVADVKNAIESIERIVDRERSQRHDPDFLRRLTEDAARR